MIDGLCVSSMLTRQFHWLTRADAFWNPIFRPFLYSFNHLPIYRTRDKLTDLRERNEIIFNCCIDRMEIGASIALFPEETINLNETFDQLNVEYLILLVAYTSIKFIKVEADPGRA